MDVEPLKKTVADLMPGLVDDLCELVAIPSCAFPGFPHEPVLSAANACVELLKKSGAANAHLIDMGGGSPAVYAEVPGPEGAPTVLLYAHYDVQPAPAETGWDTDPWTPTRKADGRIYGRGTSDDKSGVIMNAGTLQAFGGTPPVTMKFVFEGEEETGNDRLGEYLTKHPELAQSDVFVIPDSGNPEVGRPAITSALRGLVEVKVTVRTLDRALHSGLFGGAAPDALVALIKLLSTLHDDAGNTAIDGLHRYDWQGTELDEKEFRDMAGVADGVQLVGTGSLASRVWSQPSATVIGMDVPPMAGSPRALVPQASAKVSLRLAPGSNPESDVQALIKHLESHTPWGAEVEVERLEGGDSFIVDEDSPVVRTALDSMTDVFGVPASSKGGGGGIPLVAILKRLCPDADVIIWGAEDDEKARIHASNESVDPKEIESMIVSQALFLSRLAGT